MDLVSLIIKIKKFGIENVFRRYYSIYPGQVVDNVDPEDRGRVKLLVPDILDDKELAEWAEPMLPTAGLDETVSESRTGGKYGSFYPLKINDFVWVKFRMGDLRNPVYLQGGWWGENEKPDFLSGDRKNAVFISRYGHQITVDETDGAAKINISTNKDYALEIDETDDQEKITIINGNTQSKIVLDDTKDAEQILIEAGNSKNKIQLYDQDGSEYILIEDKNGNSWKWDVAQNKWEVTFTGEKTEEIQKALNLLVGESISVESGTDAKFKQPQVAIGNGTIELLEQIYKMMTELGKLKVLTPVGPAAPLTASPEWAQVTQELDKIKTITGTF